MMLARYFGVITLVLATSFVAASAEDARYIRRDGKAIEARLLAAAGAGCAPLAIISHGLGGNSRGNAPLAAALNRTGFRVVVLSHPESGPRLLMSSLPGGRNAIAIAAADPALLRLRLEDISAVLETEAKGCKAPFKLLAGHSMGSRTVNIEAGAGNSAGLAGQDRFDAYISISPLGEGGSGMFPKGSYRSVKKPMLMITGTEDNSVDGPYESRLSAFDGLPAGRKRLAIISGASHMALGGRGGGKVGETLGAIAAEFAQQTLRNNWKPASRMNGITISEK